MCRKKIDKKNATPYNTSMTIQPIILAGGNGTRMKGEQSKVLLEVGGKPILQRVVDVIHRTGLKHPMIVINKNGRDIQEVLGRDYRYVIQQTTLGTGHAVAVTQSAIKNRADHILVLYGDHPFISSETIQKLIQTHEAKGATMTLVTYYCPSFEGDNQPLYDFGRILRDTEGNIIGIRELKDCTDEEKKITEVNPSFFIFRAPWLWENIHKLSNNNAQKEYYLTDLVAMAVGQGERLASYSSTNTIEALGINTPEQLERARQIVLRLKQPA
jgi:bifunctional UDP-N-acetylglucosamine pyrophosphorylase/glucosamine-1-phosphate N-acetyltransferase